MNIIGLASYSYLADGAVILPALPKTDIRKGERRTSRTKTLDGGVVITDSGYADGDRTFTIEVKSSLAMWNKVWAIFKSSTLLTVTTDDGCFSGAANSIKDDGNMIVIEILIKAKLSS